MPSSVCPLERKLHDSRDLVCLVSFRLQSLRESSQELSKHQLNERTPIKSQMQLTQNILIPSETTAPVFLGVAAAPLVSKNLHLCLLHHLYSDSPPTRKFSSETILLNLKEIHTHTDTDTHTHTHHTPPAQSSSPPPLPCSKLDIIPPVLVILCKLVFCIQFLHTN